VFPVGFRLRSISKVFGSAYSLCHPGELIAWKCPVLFSPSARSNRGCTAIPNGITSTDILKSALVDDPMLKFEYESQLLTGMIAGADRPSVSWGNFF